MTLWGREHYTHFKDDSTESKRIQVTNLNHVANQWQSWDLKQEVKWGPIGKKKIERPRLTIAIKQSGKAVGKF